MLTLSALQSPIYGTLLGSSNLRSVLMMVTSVSGLIPVLTKQVRVTCGSKKLEQFAQAVLALWTADFIFKALNITGNVYLVAE